MKVFSLQTVTRQRYPPSSFLFKIILKSLARASRQEKEIKMAKGEVKLSFSEVMMLYIEAPINSYKTSSFNNQILLPNCIQR